MKQYKINTFGNEEVGIMVIRLYTDVHMRYFYAGEYSIYNGEIFCLFFGI